MTELRPDFIVRGSDSRDYPATRDVLRSWVREGQIARNQLIYDVHAGHWTEAALHPEISAAFVSRSNAPEYAQRTLLLLLFVAITIWVAAFSYVWGYILALLFAVAAWFTATRSASPIGKAIGAKLTTPAEAACLASFAAVLVVLASFDAAGDFARSRDAAAEAQKEAQTAAGRDAARKREAEERFGTAVGVIRSKTTSMAAVADACGDIESRLPDDLRSRCASAHLSRAEAAAKVDDTHKARAAIAAATALGASGERVRALDKRLQQIEKREAKRREQEAARIARESERSRNAEMIERRKAVGRLMRERFLDSGMDVEVRVTGKNADRMQLEWVLFGDVWSHRLQKDGIITELCNGGFKRIDLDDGHDWGVYFTCP